MNELQIFKNEKFGEVRVIEVNGEPYFVGRDLAIALGYSNPVAAISQHVDNEDSVKHAIPDSQGFTQQTTLITEAGVYSLIFGSKLPTAKQFKRWVISEVLPSIRKTGSYTMKAPQTYSEALRQLADAVEKNEVMQLRLAAKTEQLDESKNWYSIKRWAKEYGMDWRKISWRALKAISMEHGFEVKKIFDGNYGEVNLYHRKAFAILFGK